MDRNEQLHKNYEDALFALLMDEVAREEGARLLEENERLQNDPDAAVPEELDRKSRETIRRALAGHRRPRHSAGWYLSKIAVAVLAALLLFVTAYAAFPSVRLRTLKVLLESSDVSSLLSLSSGDGAEAGMERQTLAGYALPDIFNDYTVVDQGETSRSAWISYAHDDGSEIRISVSNMDDAYLDDEDAAVSEEIELHGYSGVLIEKANAVYAFWYDSDNEKIIALYTTNISKSMALAYAEQIVFVG